MGIDWLLGGGLPVGRIIEIFGQEYSGKTTLAAEIARAVQRSGRRVLYLDWEHSVDIDYFRNIGLEVDDPGLWIYDQPATLEQGGTAAMELIKTGEIGLFIADSVAAMRPRDELESKLTEYNVGLHPRQMGRLIYRLVPVAEETGTSCIFINQTRAAIGSYGNPVTTPGGKALRFFSSVRLQLSRMKSDKEDYSRHKLKLIKQKTCPFFEGSVEFEIGAHGIDIQGHVLQCLMNAGVLQNRSGTIFFGENRVCRGVDKLFDILEDGEQSEPFLQALKKVWRVA